MRRGVPWPAASHFPSTATVHRCRCTRRRLGQLLERGGKVRAVSAHVSREARAQVGLRCHSHHKIRARHWSVVLHIASQSRARHWSAVLLRIAAELSSKVLGCGAVDNSPVERDSGL